MRRGCRDLLVAALVAGLWSVTAQGQARVTGADVRGVVQDASGGAVAGAAVTVTDPATNLTRTVAVDDRGRAVVAALPPGVYLITAASPGFQPQRREVALMLGQTLDVPFTLAVSATDAVAVDARLPLVAPGRGEIGTAITQDQIQALPTNGRNFIGFAALAAGVAVDRTPLQGSAATSGLSFAGQRARSNNVTVDGLDNNDVVLGAVRATFSQEAVREFQVLVNGFSAEFGKASGGLVNIVTKSGTNAVHGSAFGFGRHESLNAAGHFQKVDVFGQPAPLEKPRYRQGQWGGTIGGPLLRDRTFFFGSYEGTRITDARLVTIVPEAAALLSRLGFAVDTGNVPFHVRNDEWLAKVDHQWTPSRALVLRGNYAGIDREGLDDFGGIVARSRATVQRRKDWAVSASLIDVVSSRWLHELRGQYADQDQDITSLDPACGGGCVGLDQGGPTVDVTGVASVGRHRFSPFLRRNRRVQLLDTVSIFAGAHHVKTGADYSALSFPGADNVLAAHFGGRYIFSPIPALGVTSSLDGLRRGLPAAYIQAYGDPHYPDERYGDLSLFLQDEWRLGRVTLRPGIRYQIQFWQDATFTVPDVAGTSFTFPLPRDRNNLAPRLGVSVDLTGSGRTRAHGSYGVFYDNVIAVLENAGRLTTSGAARTLAFPAPLAAAAWNAPGRRLTEAQAAMLAGGVPAAVVSVPSPSLETPYAHHLSGGIDHELGADTTIAANVVVLRGRHQPGTLDYNPLLPARLGTGRRPNDTPCTGAPPACVNGGVPGTSSSVVQFTSFGETWFTGLTLEVRKRVSRGSQFQASYTLGRAQDTSTDFQTAFLPQNNGYGRDQVNRGGFPVGFEPRSEKGPSTQDQRHRLVLSGIHELPWRLHVSGIANLGSGRPFTPLAGADLNGDGNAGQFPPDRARRNPLDASTSVGRNSERTKGTASVDLRVSRRFPLGRSTAVEAIVEAFNVFNRVNFVEDTNQSSFAIFGTGAYPSSPLPTYGRYTQAGPPRQVQLAARLTF